MKWNFDSVLRILSVVIPLFAVIISYLVGVLSQFQKRKIDALKERYNDLYVPYFKLVLKIPKNFDLSEYPGDRKLNFSDLFMDKCYLMGPSSSRLLFDFYTFTGLTYKNRNRTPKEKLKEYDKRYEEIFTNMESCLLSEGQEISKKLQYPDLATTIRELHQDRVQMEE